MIVHFVHHLFVLVLHCNGKTLAGELLQVKHFHEELVEVIGMVIILCSVEVVLVLVCVYYCGYGNVSSHSRYLPLYCMVLFVCLLHLFFDWHALHHPFHCYNDTNFNSHKHTVTAASSDPKRLSLSAFFTNTLQLLYLLDLCRISSTVVFLKKPCMTVVLLSSTIICSSS
jgi:hypothetical protein